MAKFFEPQDREWVNESGVSEIHKSHNQEPMQEKILRKESTHPNYSIKNRESKQIQKLQLFSEGSSLSFATQDNTWLKLLNPNMRLNCTQPKRSTRYFCSTQLQLFAGRLDTGRERPIRGFFCFFNKFCSCLINFRVKKSSLSVQLHKPLQYMLLFLIHTMFLLLQPV